MLIASLVIQLLALALPLFTQAIIDKVVVHRTQSTLITLAVAMGVFTLFSAALAWVRQYLILFTGNRVDAVLGGPVWNHLLRLPMPYFAHRPTGVIAARLHGVETIREFLASAAVTLILDLPFLLIFVAIMFWYSVTLTLVVLAILTVIVGLSLLVAPIFQRRLNEQFLRGARHQAFVTEYVAGMETVKSLQLEPQLNDKYAALLAAYLESGPAHPAARQHLQHDRQRARTVDDAADPRARRLDRDDHRHDHEWRLHDRHAGRVPDVRAACVAADAAAGRACGSSSSRRGCRSSGSAT